MKQYCKYCNNCNQIEDDMAYCQVKNAVLNLRQLTRLNKCNIFEFNEIDVSNENHIYKPRATDKMLKVEPSEQTNLFDKE